MKRFLLFLAVIAVSDCYAQFKTTYNQNGDPLTEIIDDIGMRQGDWFYYDVNNKIYKKEKYLDNNLIYKVHIINSVEVSTLDFKEVGLNIPDDRLIELSNITGEFIIDSKSGLESLFYYKKNQSKDISEDKVKAIIEGIISTQYKDVTQIIFTF